MRLPKRCVAWLFAITISWLCLASAGAQDMKKDYVAIPANLLNRELTTTKNRHLRFANYQGKTIVVNLFAHWCGPCIINLRDLIQFKKYYKTHSFVLLGLVSQKNDPIIATVRKFTREQKIKFDVIWDANDFQNELVKLVNGQSVIPQTFIIDKDGRIRKHFQGYSPLNSLKLLREDLDEVSRDGDE
jgi:peroxiredoxin